MIGRDGRNVLRVSTQRHRGTETSIDFVGRHAAYAGERKGTNIKSHSTHRLLYSCLFFLPRAEGAKSMRISVSLCLCVERSVF